MSVVVPLFADPADRALQRPKASTLGRGGEGRPQHYPGGKGAPGVAQRLINLMAPHHTYIEPFVGGGAVLRTKRLAARNIAVDRDPGVIAAWAEHADIECHVGCGIAFLRDFAFRGDELVYCDPPYLRETRAAKRAYYDYEMTKDDHIALLDVLTALPCPVMLSGYASALYDEALSDWHRTDYTAATRGETRTESLWLNGPPPTRLHDYRFLGEDFRERERIKRKRTRWTRRLEAMPLLERQALLAAMEEAWPKSCWGRDNV